VDAKGNEMPYASRVKMTAGLNYESNIEGAGHVVFDLNGNYNSEFNWDADNVIKEPAHFLLDGSIALTPKKLDHMTFRLWAKNITDEKWNINYYAQASGSAFSSAPGAPRTYGADVQVNF
jgi:iron complex outermembrane recepter protein